MTTKFREFFKPIVELFEKIHAMWLIVLCIVMIAISAIFMIATAFYFNNWLGSWSRISFIAISVAIASLIITCLKHTLIDDNPKPGNFARYWFGLGLTALFLGIEFYLAGFMVHIKTTCYDTDSGKLQPHSKVCWKNPWERNTVILLDKPDNEHVLSSSLFPGGINVNLHARPRLGASRYVLAKNNYIGLESLLWSAEDLDHLVSKSYDLAILQCGITPDDMEITEKRQKQFVKIFKEQLRKNLPPYLETSGIEVTY